MPRTRPRLTTLTNQPSMRSPDLSLMPRYTYRARSCFEEVLNVAVPSPSGKSSAPACCAKHPDSPLMIKKNSTVSGCFSFRCCLIVTSISLVEVCLRVAAPARPVVIIRRAAAPLMRASPPCCWFRRNFNVTNALFHTVVAQRSTSMPICRFRANPQEAALAKKPCTVRSTPCSEGRLCSPAEQRAHSRIFRLHMLRMQSRKWIPPGDSVPRRPSFRAARRS
jgi:hypothetical protein